MKIIDDIIDPAYTCYVDSIRANGSPSSEAFDLRLSDMKLKDFVVGGVKFDTVVEFDSEYLANANNEEYMFAQLNCKKD